MKHTISIMLAAVILTVLTGCGAVGKQSATVSENEKGTVLTVRIVNQSAVNLHGIAASYSVNGEALGSKVCERIEGNAAPVEYEFDFLPDELPADPMDTFRLDVFAAEKAGENYAACGSATIKNPQTWTVYTLTLSGDSLPGLSLSSTEKAVVVTSREGGSRDGDETMLGLLVGSGVEKEKLSESEEDDTKEDSRQ